MLDVAREIMGIGVGFGDLKIRWSGRTGRTIWPERQGQQRMTVDCSRSVGNMPTKHEA